MKTNTAQTQPTARQIEAATQALRPDPATIYTRVLSGNHRSLDIARQLLADYPSLDPRRVARAIPLVDSKLIIAPTLAQDPNIYHCPSSNPLDPKYYRVDTLNHTCTCPDSADQGNVCKHRIAIRIFQQLYNELPSLPDPTAPTERPWTDPTYFSHVSDDPDLVLYCHWQVDNQSYYTLFFLTHDDAISWIDNRIGNSDGLPAPWNHGKGKFLGKIKTWEITD
jgi:hypothetical protein